MVQQQTLNRLLADFMALHLLINNKGELMAFKQDIGAFGIFW